jgi:RNA polymerase sigma-70 factor, ECF subfamily
MPPVVRPTAGRTPGAADDAAAIAGSVAEPERFAVIFERHAPHIQRYLARRLDRTNVDDLVAETFLAAFGRRHRYDPARADARPWLYGIATRVLAQHRREEERGYRLRQAAVASADAGDGGHDERVTTGVAAAALRGRLAAALAELPARDRDVLLLVAWEDLSYDEVAAALSIPPGTVASRLNRARRRLKERLTGGRGLTTVEEMLTDG